MVRLTKVAYSEPRESNSIIQALITLPFGRWIGAAKHLPKSISSMALTSARFIFPPQMRSSWHPGKHTNPTHLFLGDGRENKRSTTRRQNGKNLGALEPHQTLASDPGSDRFQLCDPQLSFLIWKMGTIKPFLILPIGCWSAWFWESCQVHLLNVSWIFASWHHIGPSHHHLSAGDLP